MRFLAGRRLVALAVIAGGLAAGAWADTSRDPGGFQVSVGVTLNTVSVAVLDQKGRYRLDLKQGDFELLVNGKKTEIADFGLTEEDPLDLAVLLDVSGSMRYDRKIERARWMVQQLVERLRADERAALMFFADGRIETAVRFGTDRKGFLSVLEAVKAFGKTALSDALVEAADLVESQEDVMTPALVLITDGFENASRTTLDKTLEHLRFLGVPVYPLAIVAEHMADEAKHPDAGSDFELLHKIAADTGGRSFVVTGSASMSEAVVAILKDLRSRYRLGYYGPDSEARPSALTVNVPQRDMRVRYRRAWKQ